MRYTITIDREDGYRNQYMIDEKFIRESSLVQFHVDRMLNEMLDTPEMSEEVLKAISERPPTYNIAREWVAKNHPDIIEKQRHLQDLASFHQSEEWQRQQMQALARMSAREQVAHLYGSWSPPQVEKTEDATTYTSKFEKGVSDDGNPKTD